MNQDSQPRTITPVSLFRVSIFTRLFDGLITVLALCAAYTGYVLLNIPLDIEPYIVAGGLGVFFQQNIFHLAGVYRTDRLTSFDFQFTRASGGWLFLFLLLIVLAFFSKTSTGFSRAVILVWFISGWFLLILYRLILRRNVMKWIQDGRLRQRVAVVGADLIGQEMISVLKNDGLNRYDVVGYFDDRSDRVPEKIGDVVRLGAVVDILDYAHENHLDVVLIALPWAAERRIQEIVSGMAQLPIDLRLCPENLGQRFIQSGYSDVAGVPVLNLRDRPLNDQQMFLKTVEDRILGILLLAIFSPLMLVVALLIKLDSPGPVLFRQPRFGFNNLPFDVLKFRTMHHEKTDVAGEQSTRRDDDRITRIGKFLRKSSIDELPQIINVVRGEMSVVGPRPHPIGMTAADRLCADVVDEYANRHRIKPGITGWAQVNGWRGATHQEEQLRKRVEFDLHYIENWSLWLDFKIIVLTVFELIRSRNAY